MPIKNRLAEMQDEIAENGERSGIELTPEDPDAHDREKDGNGE